VFQNYALYPHMSVYDNMGFGLRLHKLKKREIQERVLPAAEMLGLGDLLKKKPGQLSGGQRQRVAMGRAIVREPDALLMDEPLSNLDAKLRVEMRAYVSLLHQRVRTTTLYVTHDQTEAMTMGDRVVVMRDGRLEQCDVPQRLYDSPENLFVAGFIGSPAMNLIRCKLESGDGAPCVELCGTTITERPRYSRRSGRRARRASGRRADRPFPAPRRQLDGRSHRRPRADRGRDSDRAAEPDVLRACRSEAPARHQRRPAALLRRGDRAADLSTPNRTRDARRAMLNARCPLTEPGARSRRR